MSYEENNSQNQKNLETKILPSNPPILTSYGNTIPKKKTFTSNLKTKLLGISNLNSYINSINLIEKKVMQNDSNGFLRFSNLEESEKNSL